MGGIQSVLYFWSLPLKVYLEIFQMMMIPWRNVPLEQDSWRYFWGLPMSESSNAEGRCL